MAIDVFAGAGPAPDDHIDGPDSEARIERGMLGIAGEAHPSTERLLAEKDETGELGEAIDAMDAGHFLAKGLPD